MVISPDDGHIVARNMYRKAINILRKQLCTKLVLFTKFVKARKIRKISSELMLVAVVTH